MLHPKIESLLRAQVVRVASAKHARLPRLKLEKRDFALALRKKPFALITEVKPSSPAQGVLRQKVDAGEIAAGMQLAGADAISVLTEQTQFGGSLENLAAAKRACSLPVLAKDFVVDEFQIAEAGAYGADAILLIAEFLGERLAEFIEMAKEEEVQALVECFSREGLEVGAGAGAQIIGVNNRNFGDLSVDLGRTLALAPLVPRDCIFVSESGISSRADIERLLPCGVDAFLVGTSIMRSQNAGEKIRELLGGQENAL